MPKFPSGPLVLPRLAAAPASNPPAGHDQLYVKADGKLYTEDPAGVETLIGPATAAGGAEVQGKRVAANLSNSLITYIDIPALSFTLAANTAYALDYFLFFTTAATTTGIGLQFGGTTSVGLMRARIEIAITATTFVQNQVTALLASVLGTGSTAATPLMATVHGSILTGATGGTLAMRFASEVAASAATILAGSYGIATQAA